MKRAQKCECSASGHQRIAVVLVVLALLAFTTVRTSPIYGPTDSHSTLAKTHLKQRKFCASVFTPAMPIRLAEPAPPYDEGPLALMHSGEPRRDCFFPRCSDLPPPLA